MNLSEKNNKIILSLLFLLSLSCIVSKAGLSIFSILTILYFIVNLDIKKLDIKNTLIKLSLLTFSIGIISTLLRGSSIQEILFFLKKSIFLFLFPILLTYSRSNKNNKSILFGCIFGFLIANSYSISLYIDSNFIISSKTKIASFWDLGRWRELLSYALVVATPFLFSKNKKWIAISIIVMIPCFFSILLSGGRLPYVAVGTVICLYIIIFKRRFLPAYFLVIVICASVLYFSNSSVSQSVKTKVTSIFNTETNYSNLGRLVMYQHGTKFIMHNLVNQPVDFLLGFGEKGFEQHYTQYLSKYADINEIKRKTSNQFSYNDHHNAYLNTISKRGFLYFISFYLLIYKMLKESYNLRNYNNPFYEASYNLIVCYLIAGIFYSNSFSFQTTIFFIFWATLISKNKQDISVQSSKTLA